MHVSAWQAGYRHFCRMSISPSFALKSEPSATISPTRICSGPRPSWRRTPASFVASPPRRRRAMPICPTSESYARFMWIPIGGEGAWDVRCYPLPGFVWPKGDTAKPCSGCLPAISVPNAAIARMVGLPRGKHAGRPFGGSPWMRSCTFDRCRPRSYGTNLGVCVDSRHDVLPPLRRQGRVGVGLSEFAALLEFTARLLHSTQPLRYPTSLLSDSRKTENYVLPEWHKKITTSFRRRPDGARSAENVRRTAPKG